MTKPRMTWICSGCATEFNNRANLPPRSWRMDGDKPVCGDCAGSAETTSPGMAAGATSIRCAAAPDAATANLIRNGAATDLGDPDNARRAA